LSLPSSTILAIATPPGRSARGIIRISGDETAALLDGHLTPPRMAARGERRLERGRLRLDDGLEVPVLVGVFRAPRSYTGEDSAEIQLPGNPVLLDRVIDGLVGSAGRRLIAARRAEPGEYTARAFLAGRMDLVEAEGVAATIAARSDAQLRAASMLRRGRLGATADAIAGELAAVLALVEAGIDFTDQEDVVAIAPAALRARLGGVERELKGILDRSVGAERLEAIPWVVLGGPANAGKSTLFNALLQRGRAIVSPEPGTTRDVLVEPLTITTPAGPVEVMLVDVAGDEAASAGVRGLAQEAARHARERADLLVRCIPPGEPALAGTGTEALDVHTKIDLVPEPPPGTFGVSARTGVGVERLRREIARRIGRPAVNVADGAMALRARHEGLLREAREQVQRALELTGHEELVAASLRSALDAVGGISGRVSADDVLGRIFATFCVGK
jgi:tRNA modification GTPase